MLPAFLRFRLNPAMGGAVTPGWSWGWVQRHPVAILGPKLPGKGNPSLPGPPRSTLEGYGGCSAKQPGGSGAPTQAGAGGEAQAHR